LSEILSRGPLQASEVKERAKAQGVGAREKELGVVAQKDGFDGPWIWNAAETIPKGCQQSRRLPNKIVGNLR
jgi:hypothetical protein